MTYHSGRSPDWLKIKNPAWRAVRRKGEADRGREVDKSAGRATRNLTLEMGKAEASLKQWKAWAELEEVR